MTFNQALETVRSAMRDLDPEDRLRLAESIWNEMVIDDDAPLSDELKAELDRRIADDDANPDAVIPWEIVEAEARARMRK